MIRFSSLGSGSAGNALLVEIGTTRLLVDCGFSVRELERRMARRGLAPPDLDAVLITHEHADHMGSAPALSRRFGLPVYLSTGTRLAARDNRFAHTQEIQADSPFAIGDAWVTPYTVPHDAREPTQFVFSDGAVNLVLLTDAGHVSPHMTEISNRSQALLLECNHDPGMLSSGPYPDRLKQRISGGYGHLPNAAASSLLQHIDRSRLQHVIGMHLSRDNNHPDLARAALATGLAADPAEMELATQADGFDWRYIQ